MFKSFAPLALIALVASSAIASPVEIEDRSLDARDGQAFLSYCTKSRGNFNAGALSTTVDQFCGTVRAWDVRGSKDVDDGFKLTYRDEQGGGPDEYCATAYHWIVDNCASQGKGGFYGVNAISYKLTRGSP
ncbi:uncharacterized protein LOC62_02G002925 [Vanrija pseudolonga]|uniref:Uncharacterized protein n=1 Tax=Vanrija pseudolonga TaxID=143232 RepID=A0AAF0Y9F1_9TREE|nr:hypothetical protein LOC62_02G002925 [Vanrija pseudolonga]